MSQTHTPFSSSIIDPFLLSDPDPDFAKGTIDSLSRLENRSPFFSSVDEEGIDGFEFTYNKGSTPGTDSTNSTTASNLDFSNFGFGHGTISSSEVNTSNDNSYPYPLSPSSHVPTPFPSQYQQQPQNAPQQFLPQHHNHNTPSPTPSFRSNSPQNSNRRLFPVRSITDAHQAPFHRHQEYSFTHVTIHEPQPRRRSLSQSDTDRFASDPAPEFFRLLPQDRLSIVATRGKSSQRPVWKRTRPHSYHQSSTSSGMNNATSSLDSTDRVCPYPQPRSSHPRHRRHRKPGGEGSPQAIQTPYFCSPSSQTTRDPSNPVTDDSTAMSEENTPPFSLTHISHPADFARSVRLIEVGAMAVINHQYQHRRFQHPLPQHQNPRFAPPPPQQLPNNNPATPPQDPEEKTILHTTKQRLSEPEYNPNLEENQNSNTQRQQVPTREVTLIPPPLTRVPPIPTPSPPSYTNTNSSNPEPNPHPKPHINLEQIKEEPHHPRPSTPKTPTKSYKDPPPRKQSLLNAPSRAMFAAPSADGLDVAVGGGNGDGDGGGGVESGGMKLDGDGDGDVEMRLFGVLGGGERV